MSEERRSSSIEQGIGLGYAYAKKHRDDRLQLRRIVRARSAPELRANLDPAEIAADGVTDTVAFWSGFAHGVGRYLLDEGHVLLDDRQSPEP
jgi:hypothetical protein